MTKYSGTINNTIRTDKKFQFRKHHTQMSQYELRTCGDLLKGIKKLTRSEHLKEKDIIYSTKSIYTTLATPDVHQYVLEYNEKFDMKNKRFTQRVLLHIPHIIKFKDDEGNIVKGNLKAVIDITTKELVTVYYNKLNDNHKSLNTNLYCPLMSVRKHKYGGYKEANRGLPEKVQQRFNAIISSK